jgi:hypothetical protein
MAIGSGRNEVVLGVKSEDAVMSSIDVEMGSNCEVMV